MPSGRTVTVQLQSTPCKIPHSVDCSLSINLYVLAEDMYNSVGLCGNYNNDAGDDPNSYWFSSSHWYTVVSWSFVVVVVVVLVVATAAISSSVIISCLDYCNTMLCSIMDNLPN